MALGDMRCDAVCNNERCRENRGHAGQHCDHDGNTWSRTPSEPGARVHGYVRQQADQMVDQIYETVYIDPEHRAYLAGVLYGFAMRMIVNTK